MIRLVTGHVLSIEGLGVTLGNAVEVIEVLDFFGLKL